MDKTLIKKIATYLGIGLLFLILSYGFVPEVLGGKIINQSDISSWRGMANEILQHNKANPDDPTLWTNSMFSGMPSVGMFDDFKGDLTKPIYEFLLTGTRPATYIFLSLLGGFLLMLAMGLSPALAVGGAIAIAFCSYNMQIIQVGHNTKMQAIAYMPWVLAGMLYTYKKALTNSSKIMDYLPKVVLGASLFALSLSFQIKANHPQITYYLAIVIFIYAVSLFVWIVMNPERRKMISKFFVASTLLLFIGGLGIATNLNKLIPTYKYAEFTMRGGSELSSDDVNHNKKGLDLDYATAWSYGIEETPNLLIPNFNGGASAGALDEGSKTYKILKEYGQPNAKDMIKALPLYWGPQPFTAGPMYLGAISVFLFILGLILFKGMEKWWLLVATIFAIFLAWGNHFMWFTRLMFEYAPLYNKFRTVSMALVVLQVSVPMLGFFVLDKILKREYSNEKIKKANLISFAITGGFCLLFTLIPSLAGSFYGSADANLPEVLAQTINEDRRSLLSSDALRSLILIALCFGGIFYFTSKKEVNAKLTQGLAIGLALLIFFDLALVDKRYLNSDHFITKRSFDGQFNKRPVDNVILQDTDPNYRVLDLSVNTFNDAIPSYHHKCIGGYSPVKLQRYQDLIERYIHPEINSVFAALKSVATVNEAETAIGKLPINSMLNAKYIILGPENPPIVNKNAFGNAWIINSTVAAANPDEEISKLNGIDLKTTAVIGEDFAWARKSTNSDSTGVIKLSHYAPNELRYTYKMGSESTVIFSEVYYPNGWTAWTVDKNGQETDIPLFRANWILRGAIIPAGEGELIMRFDPESYKIGKTLSLVTSITLLSLLLASIALALMSLHSQLHTRKDSI